MIGPAYVDLTFAPSVELISHVRRFVERFYDAFLPRDDAGQRIALATHELLENAVKYGTSGVTTLRVELDDPDREELQLRIVVRNRAEPTHVALLRDSIAEMAQSEDAEAYYQKVIARSIKTQGSSGLGLSRIHAEAGMALDLAIDGEEVTVIASTTIRKDAP